MEIEVENRSKLVIEKGQKAVFGRENGFDTTDPTVSRRHFLFEFKHKKTTQTEPSVSFEVLGRNPIWVRSHIDGEVRVFRRSEKGELAAGDWLCVSGKRPIWFKVRNVGVVEEDKRVLESESELAEGLLNGSESEVVDVSSIDPVKEFGFVVMGHEFDQYPKQMIRNVKNWNWFLEEPGKESDDCDESDREERRGGRRKRKKGEDNEDEELTGDSEVDEELVAKLRNVNEPKYSTRSKAHNKPQKKAKGGKSSYQKKTAAADEEGIEDENEDDETLGGFIVGEDDLEEEEEEEEEEDRERTDEYEEEEEFVEEEEEEDDDDEEVDD